MIDTDTLRSLAGKHVVGSDGERIGKIADVYESTDGGGGTFATVTTGLFGGGSSFFPLDAAEMRDGEVAVPFTKEFVKDAPRVENDEELTAPEEQRLFEYYAKGDSRGMRDGASVGEDAPDRDQQDNRHGTVGHDTSGPTTDDAMTRTEERLNVGTEKVETGRARLRKSLTTETETHTVPVSREEVRVEREPITDATAGAALDGPDISEEEHEVVLTAERPVVEKEVVPVERVRLGTETVTDEETVSEQVRKEHIETDGVDAGRSADAYPSEQAGQRTQTEMDNEPRR